MRRQTLAALIAAVAWGCEGSPSASLSKTIPSPESGFLRSPDPGFRLSDVDREQLPPEFKTVAFESLLAHIRPDLRATVIHDVQQLVKSGPVAFGPVFSDTEDPEIQRLIEEINASLGVRNRDQDR
jgi:hypothetical protein